MTPVLVVLSSDPGDIGRIRFALALLDRHLRSSGCSAAITAAAVIRAAAQSGQDRSTVDAATQPVDPVVMTTAPLLLDAESAAARAGVSPRTLRRLVAAGRIRSRRLDRRRYFTEDDITDFVRSLDIDGPDAPAVSTSRASDDDTAARDEATP